MDNAINISGVWCYWTDCITCGVRYVLPRARWDSQIAQGGYHFCPNGHCQGWSKDGCENAKLRRERDNLKQQMARIEQEAGEQRAEAAREIKRLKKRASAGTCPCCQRTFGNLATHMKHQHPAFVAEQGAKVTPIKRPA